MSDGNRLLIFATFGDKATAESVKHSITNAAGDHNIPIEALAVVEKDEQGRVHIDDAGSLTPSQGAIRGGIAGAIFGLIFPPSIIASAIIGGAIAALGTKLLDSGFPADELKQVGEGLQPGQSAVLFLGAESARDFVRRFLAEATLVTEKILPGSLTDVINAS